MPDYPGSLVDFQRRFPDDAACAHYLAALRWPDGFLPVLWPRPGLGAEDQALDL